MNQKNAIKVKNLIKKYNNDSVALNIEDLNIPHGSIFGLLGPNGAGKSTFINILAGLTIKNSGSIKICEIDIDSNPKTSRAMIGVVPQEINIDPFFTPIEILDIQAGFYGLRKKEMKNKEILEELNLSEKSNAYSRSLSGGMKRRLMVAKAMVHNPPVLVLDEPTAGVDVELRKKLWKYIKKLNSQGITIILTTHYLEEAEKLCDHIAVINKGKLVACDKKETLLSLIDIKEIQIKLSQPLLKVPKNLEDFIISKNKELLVIRYSKSKISTGKIIERIIGNNLKIEDLSTRETDLEDIFLKLLDN
ncbi:MAG: ABC transporter ATP-binding protein [Rickettsiales bacterium TMED254]|nr:hypothetical protein [Rickettsiales bacterium]RPF76428.1 MAG: ABC transporter ATP-binding protein [Rickettsiales bacterium TMED254]